MKNILIFNLRTSGHHIEYINHLVRGAIKDDSNKYFFVLKYSKDIIQPQQKNICFEFIEEATVTRCINTNKIYGAYLKSRLLFSYAKKYHIDKIFLIYLMEYIPFLFLCPSRIGISGIIYSIYLYFGGSQKNISFLVNQLIYGGMANLKKFDHLFILNDSSSASYFNRSFSTTKFVPLEDPFNDSKEIEKIKVVPNLSDVTTFLHFGCLCRRKGTIDILKAISLIPKQDSLKFKFIFAGKVDDEIKGEFYTLINSLQKDYNVEIHDRFCTDEEIHHFCLLTDYILVPYSRTSASSGLIGYAAKYNKPVIGPSDGLLGKLIHKNSLGTTLKNISPESLKESFYQKHKCDGRKYIEKNSIANFTKTIFDTFK